MERHCYEDLTSLPSLYDGALDRLGNRDCDKIVEHSIQIASKTSIYPYGEWTENLAGEESLLCHETDEHGDKIIQSNVFNAWRHRRYFILTCICSQLIM